ncbi:MAG TPA: RDD family protein [Terriglobales bacterium]|nr:RDD family protein [Terriglobales bacterium]
MVSSICAGPGSGRLAFFVTLYDSIYDDRKDAGLMATGQTPTRLTRADRTTAELTSHCAGGDPNVHESFCGSAPAEPPAIIDAAEAAPSGQRVDPNVNLEAGLNVVTNFDLNLDVKADSWRDEVAARLERYRTRRKPRTPRYPSLLLPFDAPESWSRSSPVTNSAAAVPGRDEQDFVFQAKGDPTPAGDGIVDKSRPVSERYPSERYTTEHAPEQSAKVIEFPRSAAIPVFRSSELADPIFDRPRIVEAPEMLPPPPALGGMLIEPAPSPSTDSRNGADLQSASASIGRRALAALVDGAVLGVGLAFCAAIFLRLNPSLNPVRWAPPGSLLPPGLLLTMAGALAVVAVLLWTIYEFLLVVYTGSTPGLRIVRLRLAAFDGSPLSRRTRRWRVLASFLSAFSAGLGYLWCVLDQDGLCWHDRITRTHVQAVVRSE